MKDFWTKCYMISVFVLMGLVSVFTSGWYKLILSLIGLYCLFVNAPLMYAIENDIKLFNKPDGGV
jgi:uncharacterized membrane protein